MKKIIIILISVFIMASGSLLFFRKQTQKPSHYMKDLQETLNSYEIEGVLERVDGEALKRVHIRSLFKKENDLLNYYVRLEDENTHQVQTIVRNKDGVFVYAQGFNQAFQFQTEWPNNGFKPYILENIIALFDGDYQEEKIRDGYLISANIEDISAKQTKILFNQNQTISEIALLDENGNELSKFEISTYILNPDIDDELFNMTSLEDVPVTISEALPMYPLQSYQSELVDQIIRDDAHILRYKGDQYFTLIQKPLQRKDAFETSFMNGELYVYENGIIYGDEEELSMISQGIETSIYSNELTFDEKINILLSLENNVVIDD